MVERRQPLFMVAGTDSHVDFLASSFLDEGLQGVLSAVGSLGASFSFEVAQISAQGDQPVARRHGQGFLCKSPIRVQISQMADGKHESVS